MPSYTVSFFKNLLNSNGHQFKTLQTAVEVHSESRERALEMAQERFASFKGVRNWKDYADIVEIVAGPDREQHTTGDGAQTGDHRRVPNHRAGMRAPIGEAEVTRADIKDRRE